MKQILLVGVGGFAGSVLRFLISAAVLSRVAVPGFPWATLGVNVVGSFLIGLLLAGGVSGSWYYLCVVGFCGGFTTFSTFSNEFVQMLRTGHGLAAAGYAAASLLLSALAVWSGLACGMKLTVFK